MSISFQCERCGKPFKVADELAGKAAKCKQCGQRMTIPTRASAPPAADLYDLEEPVLPPRSPEPVADEFAAPGRTGKGAMPRRPGSSPPRKAESESSGTSTSTLGKVGAVAFVVLMIGLRIYNAHNRAMRRAQANETPEAAAAIQGAPTFPAVQAAAGDRNGPIAMPQLPELGPAREIAPGIRFQEAHLPGGSAPGFSGKLWLYLPTGDHGARSLPCVMMAGAGSNLINGMDLGDGDRPEHLPYVHAGFAVLAYELDGARQQGNDSEAEIARCAIKFLAARAGLVNAHIAFEFLLAKVPQVDPERIYTAGHSSAGTMAMLFAENEPRLKGCVAYAPAIDLEKRFGPSGVQAVQRIGLGDLLTRYSPKQNESSLHCPLFLFHARDDSNVPAADSEACAQRLEQMGKSVTFVAVPTGDHYQSMLAQGIPRAIAWLEEKAGMPVTSPSAETVPPQQGAPPAFVRPPVRARPSLPGRPRGPRMGPRGPVN